MAEIAPGGNVTCYERDEFDNVTKITRFPDGLSGPKAIEEFRYDTEKANQLEFRRDEVGRTFTYTLDAAGNRTGETVTDPSAPEGSPSSISRSFSYDSAGLITSQSDGRGNQVSYSYDSQGRLKTIVYSDGTQTYTYDGVPGNIASITDPAGDKLSYQYDVMGRLIETSYTESIDDASYSEIRQYDAHGNLRELNDYNGNITIWEYDKLDRPDKRVDAFGTLDIETLYAYRPPTDAYSVVTGQDYEYSFRRDGEGHWTGQVFDGDGLLIAEYDEFGRTTRHAYDVHQNLDLTTLPDGSVIDFTFDQIGRMKASSWSRRRSEHHQV